MKNISSINRCSLREAILDHIVSMSVCTTQDECLGMLRMRDMVLEDIDNAPEFDGWIKCDERLPDKWKSVLVYAHQSNGYSFISIGDMLEDGGWMVGEFYYEKDAVTHWLPLPNRPEQEG